MKKLKRSLEDSWESVRPRAYKSPPPATARDVAGAGIAGLSAVTLANFVQWVASLFPGDFHIPHEPALVIATLIGVVYARTFKAK